MFSFEMFVDQSILQPRRFRSNLLSDKSHLGNCFKYRTVVYCFVSGFTPTEWGMIAYQYHLHFFVAVSFFLQAVYDLKSGFIFVIAFYHLITHRWCARNIYSCMISM